MAEPSHLKRRCTANRKVLLDLLKQAKYITVCSCHVTYAFESESTLCSNIKYITVEENLTNNLKQFRSYYQKCKRKRKVSKKPRRRVS